MLPTTRRRNWSTPGFGVRTVPDLRSEMNRLFADFLEPPTRDLDRVTPAADLYETDEAYFAEIELPGFSKDEVTVTVEQGVLTVSGEHATEQEKEREDYHLAERSFGRFSRSFSLPASIEQDEVTARFENGVLVVEMPKAEESKSRRIEVNVG